MRKYKSSSYELSTPVADSVLMDIYQKIPSITLRLTIIRGNISDWSKILFQPEASCLSSHFWNFSLYKMCSCGTKHQLYGHLPPITKTIQVRRTRHAGHCWRSRDELINDILLWTPTYGRAKAGRPARTYIQQSCEDTGCSPEDLPEAMNDREKWRKRVGDIRASGTTWWWWWWAVAFFFLSVYSTSSNIAPVMLFF